MKICILSHCFYPSRKRGGPTVSVTNLAKLLAQHHQVSVVTIGHDKGEKEFYSSVKPGKNRLFDCDVYYLEENICKAYYKVLKEISPEIIYVSSLFSWEYALAAMAWGKKNPQTQVIIAPRGELMPAAVARGGAKKKIYLWLCKHFLRLEGCMFHSTAKEETKAIQAIFPESRVFEASNISTFEKLQTPGIAKHPGELKLLTVGRIHPIKNIHLAIEALQTLHGAVTLDIYGSAEDKEYYQQCVEAISRLPENIHVNFCGNVEHEELKGIYPKYHCFISLTQTENFGHSIVEAIHSANPVIISDRTPWHELEERQAGMEFSLDDLNRVPAVLQSFVDMDGEAFAAWQQGALQYSEIISDRMGIGQYLRMMEFAAQNTD